MIKKDQSMKTKPENVQLIGIFMIVSGALNILAGAGWILGLLITLVGILCLPVALIPVGVGVWELVVGINIVNGKPVKNVQVIGGFEIASVLWANVLSMVAGILVLVFYNDPETKAYFESMAA
jgi:hypothetical protein